MRRSAILVTAFLAVTIVSAAKPTAQSKPTLTPADYDQFESVSPGATRGGLSPDGKWLVYNINRVGGDNELRLIPSAGSSDAPKVVAFGSGATCRGAGPTVVRQHSAIAAGTGAGHFIARSSRGLRRA